MLFLIKKKSENIFDINRVNKEERTLDKTQDLYLTELLKSSTPNYKIDSDTFNFNTQHRVGWIILEFTMEYKNLSNKENIDYINQYIIAEIGLEPTLITVVNETILVGYYFPNSPTCKDDMRLKKWVYFTDTRTAIYHTLEANWNVNVDNYNQTKEYANILTQAFLLTGQIYEIGVFQEILNSYKTTETFKKIIQLKQSNGGKKSGELRKKMPLEKRKESTGAANKKKISLSKERVKKTVLHILDKEDNPNLRVSNIVKSSKKIFEKGLSNNTVKKYLDEIKEDLNNPNQERLATVLEMGTEKLDDSVRDEFKILLTNVRV